MLRAELYCYFCGHGSGEVLIATALRRPSADQVRTAYAHLAAEQAPAWSGEQPLCPRCGGQMFLEKYGNEVVRRRPALKQAS